MKTSNSFSEILRKQNKSISGTAVKILKDKLDNYEIPYLFLNEISISKKTNSFK